MKKRFLLFIVFFSCLCVHVDAKYCVFNYAGLQYNADDETRECKVERRYNSNLHSIIIPAVVYDTIWGESIWSEEKKEWIKTIEKLESYTPTIIGAGAFSQQTDIISVNLGPINEIQQSAFSNTSIVAIESELVTYIGPSAFSNCSLLVSALFPFATTIEDMAFYNCVSLQAFVLPPLLVELGESAFEGCEDMDYVTCTCPLLKEIPSFCFRFCKDLREFDFPTMNLNKIGKHAFQGCVSLDEISIPDDITTIETSAFADCISLKKVYINGAHTNLEYSVFNGCKSLTTLRLTANEYTPLMKSIMGNNMDALQVIELKDNSTFIPDQCFYGCQNIHTVDMHEGITFIGAWAFSDCKALKKITLPNSITKIHDAAFYNSGIEEITFPDKLSYVGNEAFRNCNLKEIRIPANIDTVGFFCFARNEHLARVYIEGTPYWNTSGGSSNAFSGCKEIQYAEMMCHRDTYNPYLLFYSANESMEEFRLLEGSTALGDTGWDSGALNGMTQLKKVIIPEGVEVIGVAAFENDTALHEIDLPHSLDSIGFRAFSNTGLHEVTLPSAIRWADEKVFFQCKQLTKVDMGGLKVIPKFALYDCEALTCLIMDSVRVMDRQACAYTPLTSIYLPETCDSLLQDAVSFNTTIKKVVCKAVTPPIVTSMYNAFYVNDDIKLYVPEQSITDYSSAPLWKQFKTIEPLKNIPADPEDCHYDIADAVNTIDNTSETIRKIIDNGSMLILMPDGRKYGITGEKR